MSRMFDVSGKYLLGGFLVVGALVPLGGAHASGAAKGGETIIHAFAGGSDGQAPYGNVIADKSGNLYGTTIVGGSANSGTVYEIASDGTESVLYAFQGGSDGYRPVGSLLRDKSGNLYGTTEQGGSTNCGGSGCGTVFKLTPAGAETILYAFTGGSDGGTPAAGLIMDKKGNLYGTTVNGGTSNYGTVFELTPANKESVMHSFADGSDGASSYAPLIMDKKGNLYGTTGYGGANNGGTVFEIAPDGTETILHTFTGGSSDGASPFGSLTADKSGSLYGTTTSGGSAGHGTVFEITSGGTESVLYAFTGGSDGSNPYGNLIMDKKGNFFSTTYGGGASGVGTVFELAADGTETVLHSFSGGSDGAYTQVGLTKGKSGVLYGVTQQGGNTDCGGTGCGTVFEVKK